MILDKLIRHEEIRTYLTAPLDVQFLSLDIFDLLKVFTLFNLKQLRFQHSHGCLTILNLRAFVLTPDNYACGYVRDPYRGVGLIDVLPAGAAGTVRLYLYILVPYFYLYVVGKLGHNLYRGIRSLPFALRVER